MRRYDVRLPDWLGEVLGGVAIQEESEGWQRCAWPGCARSWRVTRLTARKLYCGDAHRQAAHREKQRTMGKS